MEFTIQSDYEDYYDNMFYDKGISFIRRADMGPKKSGIFELLEGIGLRTPRYGKVSKVVDQLEKESFYSDSTITDFYLIVYFQQYQAGGNNSIKVPAHEAMRLYPNHFCCEYIQPVRESYPSSIRYLQIGNRRWWLRYVNMTDNPSEWRSNSGYNVAVRILEEMRENKYHPAISEPIFAIDFIQTLPLLAVDFTVAPVLKGTGIDKIVSPKDVYNLITSAHIYFNGIVS